MWKEQVILRTAEETTAPPKGTDVLTDEDIYTSTSTAPVGGWGCKGGDWKLTIKPIKALSQTETEGGWGGGKQEGGVSALLQSDWSPCVLQKQQNCEWYYSNAETPPPPFPIG